jgi:hypothetical protein
LIELLRDRENQAVIEKNFPHKNVVRRNTGYALDSLIRLQPFKPDGEPLNFCKLIAGSEGTLGIVTEMKLQLIPLPPKFSTLVCIHCRSIQNLQANAVAKCKLLNWWINEYWFACIPILKEPVLYVRRSEAILMVDVDVSGR